MENYNLKINDTEAASLELGKIYAAHGFKKFKMSKFEEFSLYANNKSFLENDKIITFNDFNGRLMALRPDVTLSIVKNVNIEKLPEKVYYSENVYRYSKSSNSVTEITQTGLEYIGKHDENTISEVLLLAVESLKTISDFFVLDISHMGFILEVLDEYNLTNQQKSQIIKLVGSKNSHEILHLCSEIGLDNCSGEKISSLATLCGSFSEMLPKLKRIIQKSKSIDELTALLQIISKTGYEKNINLDFSVVNDMNYYNGIVFQGFVKDIPFKILSGGRYDYLLKKFQKQTDAIGFAVYLGKLETYYN